MKRSLSDNDEKNTLQYWERQLKECKDRKYQNEEKVKDAVNDAQYHLFDIAQKAYDEEDKDLCLKSLTIYANYVVKTVISPNILSEYKKEVLHDFAINLLTGILKKAELFDLNKDFVDRINNYIDLKESLQKEYFYKRQKADLESVNSNAIQQIVHEGAKSPLDQARRDIQVGGGRQ